MNPRFLACIPVLSLALGCFDTPVADQSTTQEEEATPIEQFTFYCPACKEEVTWSSYGKFSLTEVGDDTTANNLERLCGWSVYDGHAGGYGDTLQVASCGTNLDGVIFLWAYNTFSSIRVSEGWKGTTPEGIGIGASRDTFLAAYPEFYELDTDVYMLAEGAQVIAFFDADANLSALEIGGEYFN